MGGRSKAHCRSSAPNLFSYLLFPSPAWHETFPQTSVLSWGAVRVDLTIIWHLPTPVMGLVSYSNMNVTFISSSAWGQHFTLVIYRKGCCKCSFCRQTRSQKTKWVKAILFLRPAPLGRGRQEKAACISRYPASGLEGEGIHKTSRHSSRLGTQDHFHSLGNSFISTPTKWPWQNIESLHITAMFVPWVIQSSELMLHFAAGTKYLVIMWTTSHLNDIYENLLSPLNEIHGYMDFHHFLHLHVFPT